MRYRFSKTARKDLARSFARTSAKNGARKAVAEIELLTRIYHENSIARGSPPEKLFRSESRRIFDYADWLCIITDIVGPRTRKRMESELEVREEKMSLDEYFQSVNDICMFALHAAGQGERPLSARVRRADEDLVELTSDVLGVYRRYTNSEPPKVPTSDIPSDWRTVRKLQCHPLWIVYDQLGIYLGAHDVNRLVKEHRIKASELSRSARMVAH
jgi:hypothetical protein